MAERSVPYMGCHDGGLTSFVVSVIDFFTSWSVAEAAAAQKRSKSAAITLTHIFDAVAFETLEPVKAEGFAF